MFLPALQSQCIRVGATMAPRRQPRCLATCSLLQQHTPQLPILLSESSLRIVLMHA